jgi:hypothetical protein
MRLEMMLSFLNPHTSGHRNVLDGIRTHDLRRDRATSTPGCSARTKFCNSVAQVGLEPTASLVLSESGLPIAYRAVLISCAQDGSRTHKHLGLSQAALPICVRERSSPGWS